MRSPLSGLADVPALRIADGARADFDDRVAVETPVALVYNGEPHAVMMASPTDLEDFLLGFSLTEGIVASPDELALVERLVTERGVSLQALIPHARLEALRERRRSLAGRSGCGLCGIESLAAALPRPPRVGGGGRHAASDIADALARLAESQPLNRASGGVHAAAYAARDALVVREDVGRHNAVDKLVGALARAPAGEGVLVVTSRASYEIVLKAAMAGIAVVAAVSAPTDLAIRVAGEAGITLVAFARGGSMNVYTGAERIS